jgi:hypothetical protein
MQTASFQEGFRNTPDTAVVPFYLYAAISFLVSTILLFVSAPTFLEHYFSPQHLALTHAMALGWGTMIILGASHQLVPVLTEKPLYSIKLAHLSFILAAAGIPLLVWGFYTFNMGWPAKWGGRLVLLSVLAYLINIWKSVKTRKAINIHALFIVTAAGWLFVTALLGLALVYNFTWPFLQRDILAYLPLHAHAGILGWFLMLIIGVGSRLIPMFLISKYQDNGQLRFIYFLINGGLLYYLSTFYFHPPFPVLLPAMAVATALLLFISYIILVYRSRIRKQVDMPMKISLVSVLMMVLPVLLMLVISGWLMADSQQLQLVLLYGFIIFFGWITSIILGMTFKTLPFIVWNKLYYDKAGLVQTPNPKDLVSETLFKAMALFYLSGLIIFIAGAFTAVKILLQAGALGLILAALLYNLNVFNIWQHKPKQ